MSEQSAVPTNPHEKPQDNRSMDEILADDEAKEAAKKPRKASTKHRCSAAHIDALLSVGARIFPVRQDKTPAVPKGTNWQTHPFSREELVAHKGPLAILPGSIGLSIIDIDAPQYPDALRERIERIGEKFCEQKTLKGGSHIAFKTSQPVRNAKWTFGEVGGDFRGKDGYAVMWEPAVWAEAVATLDTVADANAEFQKFFEKFSVAFKYNEAKNQVVSGGGYNWNRESIKEAVDFLDPSVDRQQWIGYCRAIADAGMVAGMDEKEIFELVKEWSAKAPNWGGENDLGGVFQLTATYKGPHAASGPLMAAAKAAGWTPTQNVLAGVGTPTIAEALAWLNLDFRMEFRGGQEKIRYVGAEKSTGDVREEWTGWVQISTPLVCSIVALLEDNFHVFAKGENKTKPLTIGRVKVRDVLHHLCFINRVDGFREYLEGLPEWDRVARINYILRDHFGAADAALTEWASRYPFIGPVERCYEPGKLHRVIPILQGKEDIGKSALLKHLLPPHLQIGGFSDQLKLDDNPQRQIEQLSSAIIVELAELVGLRRADNESLKSFITRTTDKIRKAYGEEAVEDLRRFVLTGTTNDKEPLPNDPGGNSRYVVIPLTKGCNVEKLTKAERDQWWAEALYRYKENEETGQFDRKLRPQQQEQAEQFRSKNEVIEDAIEEWAAQPKNQEAEKRFKLVDIAQEAGIIAHMVGDLPGGRASEALKLTRPMQLEMGACLRQCGFDKKKGKNPGWTYDG